MKSFIIIDNEFLSNNDKINTFSKIGTEGFALYCYLLTQQANKNYCQINIRMIIDFFNRKNDKPKKLLCGTKEYNIRTMKDKKTVFKYLEVLKNNNFIKVDEIKCNLNNILTIKVNKVEPNNFTKISEELFVDYIYKIGHIGWSLLYILTKLHNSNYGSISCEGFANPTQEYLSSIIKRNKKTISMYLFLLQDYKLIKIKSNEPIYKGINAHGVELYEYLPNNYIVKNKLQDNKYYLK